MRLGGERMERKLCGAKTKSGESCKKAALANGRCRFH
ncbi:HGGxSTG domain-containing protein [Brevibacillus parabrevis]